MNLDEYVALAAVALAGVLFGLVYFGGLWLTVQQVVRVKNPLLLFAGSFILRLGLVLAGFYLVLDGRIERLAVCLVAFFLTRQFFIKWAQFAPERSVGSHGNQS